MIMLVQVANSTKYNGVSITKHQTETNNNNEKEGTHKFKRPFYHVNLG